MKTIKAWFMALLLVMFMPLATAGGVSSAYDGTARAAAAAAQSTASTALANYNPASVAITGGTISGSSGTFTSLNGGTLITSGAGGGSITDPTFQINASGGTFTVGTVASSLLNVATNGGVKLNSRPLIHNAAPTIASGFGTGAAIVVSNGSAVMTVNVGTGGTASSGAINMPVTAVDGWVCMVSESSFRANAITQESASTTTTVTVTSYTVSTGAVVAWPASIVLRLMCLAR